MKCLRKKINALKAEHANIRNKQSSILDETEIYMKKGKELENEAKIPEIPIKVLPSTFSKKVLAKTENDIKCLELVVASTKLELDINKNNVNIDKANIELIKAEIKQEKRQRYLLNWHMLSLNLPSLHLRA